MGTNKRIKIITNSGFKYEGELISEDNIFLEIMDNKQGKIKIPLVNISIIKEIGE
jgi:small nuclear ribonucleoprotein (snRNP)-like protein